MFFVNIIQWTCRIIHEVSFTTPKVMWTLIMKLPHTEVKFYPEAKSQTGLSSLRVSCKQRALMFTWKSHAVLKFHFGQNERYEVHTVLSFISLQFMWTQVKSWLNTEVRFSTKVKSHTGLSSFRLSSECTLSIIFKSYYYLYSKY